MNPSIVGAWAAGMAIVTWRMVHNDHRLPVPGALLGISALFAAGAMVADLAPRAGGIVALALWGLDVAALLDVLPAGLSGQIAQSEAATATASGEQPGRVIPGVNAA